MRLFLILCSLAGIAYGKPQYNYGTGISGTSSTGFSGGSAVGGGFLTAPHVGSTFGTGSSLGGSSFGGFGGSSLGGVGFSSGGTSGFGGSYQGSSGFAAPVVHKQFYTISAPEDNEHLERTKHFVIGRPQKNYRVIFIKAPSSSNANVKLSAEYAPQEEKTAIYVLTKKDASLEVNDIATPAPTVPSKPEIFFIKYKTDEEAQHAQRTIQAEYDKIQGTSEHADGGVAPVQSVIGSLDNGAGAGVSSGIDGGIGSVVGSGIGSGIGSSIGSEISSGISSGISAGAKSPTYLPPGK